MEIAVNKNGSISIGGVNSTLVVDPQDSGERGDVVLFMDGESALVEKDFGDAIVVVGAGEYEVGEFLIHGEMTPHGAHFAIECNGERLFLVNSSDIESISSDTRYATILVRLDDAFDEGTSSTLPGELVVLYETGNDITPPKVEKMDKIGKRKKSELAGKTILLSRS